MTAEKQSLLLINLSEKGYEAIFKHVSRWMLQQISMAFTEIHSLETHYLSKETRVKGEGKNKEDKFKKKAMTESHYVRNIMT